MKLSRYNDILDPLIKSGAIYVIAGIVVLATFIWPLYGLAAFLAWLPVQSVFPAEGLFGSVAKWFGLVLFLASLFNIFKRIDRVFNNREVYIYFSFVLWGFFSILWSQNSESCIYRNITYLQLFLLYIIIITATDRQNYPLLLKAFVIGAMLSLMTIPFGSGAHEVFYERAAGGGMDENEYASTIAVALVLALTWILMEKALWKKIIPMVFIPLGLLGIAYTKSRTGTFALLPFVIYLAAVFIKKGVWVKFLTILIVTASMLTLIYLRPEGYVDRVTEINQRSGNRLYIWSVGLKMIADNFLLGVGSGNFAVAFPKYAGSISSHGIVAHNSFVSVFGELGIIGLSLFIWLFYSHFKNLLTFFKMNRDDEPNKIIAKGLFYAFMTFLIASLGIAWEYNKLIPFILGSIMLLTKIGNQNAQER
jgi:O-antigen ligase